MAIVITQPLFLLQKVTNAAANTQLFGLNTTPTPDYATQFLWISKKLDNVFDAFITGHGFRHITWGMFGSLYSKSPASSYLYGLNASPSPDYTTIFHFMSLALNNMTVLPLGGFQDSLTTGLPNTDKAFYAIFM